MTIKYGYIVYDWYFVIILIIMSHELLTGTMIES